VPVLLGAPPSFLRVPWEVPYGSFSVALDPLSAFFLVPIFLLAAVTALYGSEYLQVYRERKSLSASWFFFNLLIVSLTLVVIARNGILFLVAWELMALSSFFLVTFEDEYEDVRDAGWTYLVATHLGTVFLLALFILLGREHGSLDFDQFTASAGSDVLFLLAVIGFGAKAGFLPLHVWLPEAHPAAPTHVSALMSGVMIKTGIYGFLRVLLMVGPPQLWWGWLLCGIGIASGIFGIVCALGQRDLKRLLAYSSVEHIGLITASIGLGVIGLSIHAVILTVFGFAGALFHVVNHALFKGLLFLGAGAVTHGAGTRDLEHLGGLLKCMPVTGVTFLVGAVAITGLPPLNGFMSELLMYGSAFQGAASLQTTAAVPALVVLAGLALIGGLTAACFTKAFGIAFLGESRSEQAAQAHEVGLAMRLSLLILAVSCGGIGLGAPWIITGLAPTLITATGLSADSIHVSLTRINDMISSVVLVSVAFVVLLGLFAILRRRLLAGRSVETTVTWDCGYAQPSARMQYSGSSFAHPLTSLLSFVLHVRADRPTFTALFPSSTTLETRIEDLAQVRLYQPVFSGVGRSLAALRWVQSGQVHLYILYIALTLLVLLVWQLG
jgi:formate hydrogenlyase subunit 3/multisubunit Na+/H+ antiporter MnhD subunit